MRKKERQIVDQNEIRDILTRFTVCRLGMRDGDGVYIVPLSPGVSYENQRPVLYFHCAKAGHKLDLLRENPNVCFEMDGDHALVEGALPCNYTYHFVSVIGTGRVSFVEADFNKRQALIAIMKQQTGKDFSPDSFDDRVMAATTVLRVDVDALSCKAHR